MRGRKHFPVFFTCRSPRGGSRWALHSTAIEILAKGQREGDMSRSRGSSRPTRASSFPARSVLDNGCFCVPRMLASPFVPLSRATLFVIWKPKLFLAAPWNGSQ